MILTVSGSRLELDLTKAEALQLIERLSRAVAHANRASSAWFADGIVVEAAGNQSAGRITIRVEG